MISVITPVYNGEQFIAACIQVVIDQQCPDVEHIIIDGGSNDQTVDIIKRYAEQYSHIRWLSEKDQGQSDAMNKGITMAKGEIIAILNVDDDYEANVLNHITEIFKPLPEPSFSGW
jgi:glycosyltransferase involved in cell wall biosynthesis